MSVGALSPEAHQALTIGIQRAGGAANTGEGGEDPAWYTPTATGERHDARIKQVASARFGVTAHVPRPRRPARDQDRPGRQARRGRPAAGEEGDRVDRDAPARPARDAYISPPPHHDIYSIEDLAQLIADLRAINPAARIGVKLVATRGVGTIAAGVVKAGATLRPPQRPRGGTGASPLSSIKHVGAPWELGLAEVHQTLLRNGLRDRVALRTDGGLRTGRDLLVAALLGAEEFAFGTAMLVALGCDMARQCHLDTCPTGIATQREDLRAKFAGTPEAGRAVRARPGRGPPAGAGRRGRPIRRRGRRREPPPAGARAGPPTGRSISARSSAPRPGAPRRRGARARARRPRRPSRRASVAARDDSSSPRSAARPGSGRRPRALDRRPVVRGGAVGRARARPARGSDPPRSCAAPPASRSGRSRARRSSCGSSARRTTTSARACRAGGSSSRPEPDLAADAAPPGDRRQHLPVRRDRRPAPPRRPGRDAVRRPQLRRGGGRRGPRPARLRVHDRRGRRRARPGRRQLRGGDDRRPGLPVRPRRPPRRRARRAQRERGPPRGCRPRSRGRRRTASAELRCLVADHREAGSALAARLLAERHDLEADVWLVEPVAVQAPPAAVVAADDRRPIPETQSAPRTAAV